MHYDSYFHVTLDASLSFITFGYLQGAVDNSLFTPKDDCQFQCQSNQKNRSRKEQLAQPNLKRSGFVLIFAASLIYHLQTKRSAAVFLMSVGAEKGT